MTTPLLSQVAGLEPVLVWAPIARCGVTLLQRLVTSSREILVYGENFLLCKVLPAALIEATLLREQQEAARKRLLEGDYQFWSSAANPRTAHYEEALVSSIALVVLSYEVSTRQDGVARWGVKHPEFQFAHFQILRRFLPRARHLCLYRDPFDALRSMKARQWLGSVADAERYARDWSAGVQRFLGLANDPAVLVVRYETLLAERERELERLRAFLGVGSLDPRVLDVKVNTFPGSEAHGHSPRQYIEPVDLTPEERAAVDRITAPVRPLVGYV